MKFFIIYIWLITLKPKREPKHYSKIYKVKNFTEILRSFQKNQNFGCYGAIDESMINFNEHLPPKPIKRGHKVWSLCDSITGYLFNYQIYLGKEETEIPLGECVVFNLISGHNFQGQHLYFDNSFTSFGLLENLKLQSIKACGTFRSDRAGVVGFCYEE